MTGKIDEIKLGVFLAGQDYNTNVKVTGVSSSLLEGDSPLLGKQNLFSNSNQEENVNNNASTEIESAPTQLQTGVSENLNETMSVPETTTNVAVDNSTNNSLNESSTPALDTNSNALDNQVLDNQMTETQESQKNDLIDLENLKASINDCYENISKDLEKLKQITEQLNKINNVNKVDNVENNNQNIPLENVDNNELNNSELVQEPKLVDPLLNDAMTQIQNMPTDTVSPNVAIPTMSADMASSNTAIPNIDNNPALNINETVSNEVSTNNNVSQNINPSISAIETPSVIPPVIDEAPIQPTF